MVAWDGEKAVTHDTIEMLAAALQIRYDCATGTHQGLIENSSRQWGNAVRSWRSHVRSKGVASVPPALRIIANMSLYTQLNLMPTTGNAGGITPHEFYTGV